MRKKILLTIFLILSVIVVLYYYPRLFSSILEWLVIFIIALTLWLWRKEIGFTVGVTPIEQQTPEDFTKKEKDFRYQPDPLVRLNLTAEVEQNNLKNFQSRILNLLLKKHAVNITTVARELGITSHYAKTLLYSLVKKGKVRCDGFPSRALYTLSSSIENLAIDKVKRIVEKETSILSERRFVKVKSFYEADAIFEVVDKEYIVEIKLLRTKLEPEVLERWINQVSKVAQTLNRKGVIIYLIIVAWNDAAYKSADLNKSKYTYQINNIPIKIIILKKDNLTSD